MAAVFSPPLRLPMIALPGNQLDNPFNNDYFINLHFDTLISKDAISWENDSVWLLRRSHHHPENAMALEKDMLTDYRPWGYYVILADEPDHKVKRVVVYPGKRLSLQRHQRRSEHWFAIYGQGQATVGDEVVSLQPGESVNIPQGALHRLENPGEVDFAIVEVQRGDYFGEDDIERFEDDFGRA